MAAVLACAPSVGNAQSLFDRDANVGVRDRPQPDYDALGIQVDSFNFLPKVSASVIYDDNIYAQPTKTSDVIFVVAPELQIQSNWNRHSLQFDFASEFDEYAAHGMEDTTEYNGTVTGRIDVDHASQVTLVVSAARLTQPLTSQNTIATVLVPDQYDLIQSHLSAFRNFSRLKISTHLDFSDFSYDNVKAEDGSPVSEDFQDHYEFAGTLRGDYAISPATAVFVEGTVNDHDYRLEPPVTPFRRDSSGFDILTGVNFQVSHLVTGEVGLGYLWQRYVDREFNGVNGLAMRGQLTWYPTQLITVNLHADRTFQDSGLPNTPTAQVSDVYVTVDYELRRNLILTARGSYTRYNYPGLDRLDNRYGGGLSATYLVNRDIGITLGYSFIQQSSTGMARGFDFNDNRLALTLTLQR